MSDINNRWSKVILYKTNLLPSNNFSIDSFEYYLSSKATLKYTISNFQYIKHEISLDIKIDMNQDRLDVNTSDDFDYVAISNCVNSTYESTYYYFIVNKTWRGQSTIQLTLLLDVLNTFKRGRDYELSPKTFIKREHLDRFEKNSNKVVIDNIAVRPTSNHDIIHCSYTLPMYANRTYKTTTIKLVEAHGQETASISNISFSYDDMGTPIIDFDVMVILDSYPQLRGLILTVFFSDMIRKIDLVSENINPVLYSQGYIEMKEPNYSGSWYLYYKNRNNIDPDKYQQVNPVDCYLLPENPLNISYKSTTNSIDLSGLPNGYYVIFNNNEETYTIELEITDSSANVFTLDNKQVVFNRRPSQFDRPTGMYTPSPILIYKNGTTIEVSKNVYYKEYNNGSWGYYFKELADSKVSNVVSIKVLNNLSQVEALSSGTAIDSDNVRDWIEVGCIWDYVFYTQGTSTIAVPIGVNSIDKTLAENIKLIKLPYSPTQYSLDNSNNLLFSDCWSFDSGLKTLKLNELNQKFINTLKAPENPLSPLVLTIDTSLLSIEDKRNDELESKLFHSDYYRPKFYYDSFSLDFNLEKVDIYSYLEMGISDFNVEFITSRNIVSRFMFRFPQYILKDSTADYDNIVCVSRNNEEVLYNSAYINYIRNGYNYDLKNKQRDEGANWAQFGIGAFTTAVGIATGIITANPLPAVAGAITGVSTMASSLISTARATASNEQSIERKIQESKAQAVSVSSADDIDLLSEYSNNKARFKFYHASDRVMKQVADIFYYCGYTREIHGLPNENSRVWFNFVQADIYFSSYKNLTNVIKAEIVNKYAEGITIFHKQGLLWNIAQDKENYESWLIEE